MYTVNTFEPRLYQSFSKATEIFISLLYLKKNIVFILWLVELMQIRLLVWAYNPGKLSPTAFVCHFRKHSNKPDPSHSYTYVNSPTSSRVPRPESEQYDRYEWPARVGNITREHIEMEGLYEIPNVAGTGVNEEGTYVNPVIDATVKLTELLDYVKHFKNHTNGFENEFKVSLSLPMNITPSTRNTLFCRIQIWM